MAVGWDPIIVLNLKDKLPHREAGGRRGEELHTTNMRTYFMFSVPLCL